MRAVITGGSGFLGQALTAALAARGDEVTVLTRRAGRPSSPSVKYLAWTPTHTTGPEADAWIAEVAGADAVVNLAGEGIADRRWTRARKAALLDSRIVSTRAVVGAMARATGRGPRVLVSASGIGYYGDGGDERIDESSPPGLDFLATICVAWEAEAHKATVLGCRVVTTRNGLVLARHGGVLKKLILPFLLFGGGPVGSGRQYMPWIHLDDWVALVLWAIDTPRVDGPLNAAAPHPVTNAEFVQALGRAVHRPSWLPMPAAALRLLVGEIADVALVTGQRALPRRALELGFRFRYTEVNAAMQAAVSH